MASEHDKTAERIAGKLGGKYNRGQGPDVNTPSQATEVETAETVEDAKRQLRGFKKPVYIAGAAAKATKKAVKSTEGTTIGVRDQNGKNCEEVDEEAKLDSSSPSLMAPSQSSPVCVSPPTIAAAREVHPVFGHALSQDSSAALLSAPAFSAIFHAQDICKENSEAYAAPSALALC